MFVRHLLVPTDFSKRSAAALRYARGLAAALGAEIDLLHVVTPPLLAPRTLDAHLGRARAPLDENAVADAERQLRALVAQSAEGVRVRTMVELGDPADVIVQRAVELPSDLIVIGTHARRGVSELVLGSVAHQVITRASCPVITLRGDEVL